MWKFNGWKTYIACTALIAIGVASAFGVYVPEWVGIMIAGAAGISGRMAITNNAKVATAAMNTLIKSVVEATKDKAE